MVPPEEDKFQALGNLFIARAHSQLFVLFSNRETFRPVGSQFIFLGSLWLLCTQGLKDDFPLDFRKS